MRGIAWAGVHIDNRRLILDRTAKVVAANAAFEQASIALSLLFRDSTQNPVRVGEERLPLHMPEPSDRDLPSTAHAIELAVSQRPDIVVLEAEREVKKGLACG